uniref:5-hydroxytryptamine receptor 1F n=1 Tax=Anas platyrhynchos TaxID=8839 RepID=A0A8B9QSH4_ANAPL
MPLLAEGIGLAVPCHGLQHPAGQCHLRHHSELFKWVTSKILISITLSVLALMTTAINSLVMTAIIVTRKLHHPANYLICSLAVTDFLVAVLVMPFSIVYIVKETWIMGQVVCDIWLSVDITCCTCSILHLSAIALDRYRAITDAVEYARKRTPKHAGIMIAVVWIISIFISMPPLFWRHQTTSKDDECIIKHDHIVFTIYSTFGAFYIPLALILILYYKIYKAAKTFHRRSSQPDRERSTKLASMPSTTEKTSDPLVDCDKINITVRSPRSESKHEKSWKKQRISSTRERKAATTLGLILGAFVICWLPFFVKEVVVNTCERCHISEDMSNFLAWLGYINSLINPLIYTIFNEDFKKAFQKLVRCRQYF